MGLTRHVKFRGLVSLQTLNWKPRKDPKKYSPEQRRFFRRYVRFKARTRISCSYWDWLKKYKDSGLEAVCETANWWQTGRRVSEDVVKLWEEELKKTNIIKKPKRRYV